MADADTRQRIVAFARGLPVAHRVVIAVAGLVFVLSAFLFMRWINAPSYSVLTGDLPADELTDVTAELDARGIDYKVEAAGTRVVVVRSQLPEARAALADAGLAGQGSSAAEGNEILDSQGLSVNSDLQKINIRRALEGELEQSLARMDFIDSADVALVIPERALFVEDEEPVQASVLLDTRRDPVGQEIDSVVLLVANAVEGLVPEQVMVADLGGRVLAAPGEGMESRGDNLSLQRQVETSLEADVRRILASAGAGDDAAVVVNAVLDFDDTTIESVTYDPDSSVPIRRQLTEEQFQGVGASAGGIPGVDGGVTVGDDGTFDYTNNVTVEENGVNRTTTYTTNAAGTINGLNVAITIDDGTLTGASVPDPAQISALVTAGLGLLPARGDTIAVEAFPFPQVDPEEAAAAASGSLIGGSEGGMDIVGLATQVVGGLVLLGVLAALFLMVRRREEDGEYEGEEITLELEQAKKKQPVIEIDQMDESAVSARAEVIELVQRQPEEIAALLRGWLSEK